MFWLILWGIYGIIAIIAFVLIGVAEDIQGDFDPVASFENLTLFGKITRFIARAIFAALWLPLLILIFIIYIFCESEEKRLKSEIGPV